MASESSQRNVPAFFSGSVMRHAEDNAFMGNGSHYRLIEASNQDSEAAEMIREARILIESRKRKQASLQNHDASVRALALLDSVYDDGMSGAARRIEHSEFVRGRIDRHQDDRRFMQQPLVADLMVPPTDASTLRLAQEVRARVVARRLSFTLEKLVRVRTCLRCRDIYKRMYSIGQLQCLYHPGVVERGQPARWSCCKEPVDGVFSPFADSPRREGCMRCDHHDRSVEGVGLVAWRMDDAEIAAIFERSVSKELQMEALEEWNELEGRWQTPSGWHAGTFVPLVSKRDSSRSAYDQLLKDGGVITERDMAERDAMNKPRAAMADGSYNIGGTRFVTGAQKRARLEPSTDKRYGLSSVPTAARTILCILSAETGLPRAPEDPLRQEPLFSHVAITRPLIVAIARSLRR
jgi:hypothetical protein